jgi:hypothetical protein
MSVVYTGIWKSEFITSRRWPGRHQLRLTFDVIKVDEYTSWRVAASSIEDKHLAEDALPPVSLDNAQRLDITFRNKLYIKGELSCHQSTSGEFLIEARSLEYGFRDEEQFTQFESGVIAMLRSNDTPKPVPVPVPHPPTSAHEP